MTQRLNIFTLSEYLPTPDRSAGCRRYFELLAHLAQSHRVDLFLANRYREAIDEAGYQSRLEAVGVNVLATDRWGWLGGCLRRRRYDLGLYEFWHQADAYASVFRQHQPWAKLVVDSVDVHYLREAAAVRLGLMDAAIAADRRTRELATYRAADAVVAASEDDRRTLSEDGGMPALYVIPIIIPTRDRLAAPRSQEVLFVGGFAHLPNVDGLLWFTREIWPGVRARRPDATLTIVGNDPPTAVKDLAGEHGIAVTGYVPATGPYLDRAAVSVAPLRYGAGMKGKVSEAMAAGVPVVSTTVGVQGFGLTPGEHALVADNPTDFATSVSELLGDPELAERIGAAGRRLVEGLCTPAAVGQRVNELLEHLVPTRGRPPVGWTLTAARVSLTTWVHDLAVRPRRPHPASEAGTGAVSDDGGS